MKNIDMKKILIDTTYEASINETIETAKETTEVIEENADGEEMSIWEGIVSKVENVVGSRCEFAQKRIESVKESEA